MCYLYSLVKMDCDVLFFCVFVCVPSVRWHCWLGLVTRINPSPLWTIMCWWDVKPYSITQAPHGQWLHFIVGAGWLMELSVQAPANDWVHFSSFAGLVVTVQQTVLWTLFAAPNGAKVSGLGYLRCITWLHRITVSLCHLLITLIIVKNLAVYNAF